MPDRIRNIQVRLPMVEMDWLFVKRATNQAKIRITTVRMAVARLELTCSTPTFASIAVRPAKNAESRAQMNQFIPFPSSFGTSADAAGLFVLRAMSAIAAGFPEIVPAALPLLGSTRRSQLPSKQEQGSRV